MGEPCRYLGSDVADTEVGLEPFCSLFPNGHACYSRLALSSTGALRSDECLAAETQALADDQDARDLAVMGETVTPSHIGRMVADAAPLPRVQWRLGTLNLHSIERMVLILAWQRAPHVTKAAALCGLTRHAFVRRVGKHSGLRAKLGMMPTAAESRETV